MTKYEKICFTSLNVMFTVFATLIIFDELKRPYISPDDRPVADFPSFDYFLIFPVIMLITPILIFWWIKVIFNLRKT